MARALGYFTETDRGFEGVISTLTTKANIEITRNEAKETDAQPDYRIFAKTGAEVGGIWKKTAKTTGTEYLSCTLENPAFGTGRIYANLTPVKDQEGRHVMLWNAN